MRSANLFSNLPDNAPEELFTRLLEAEGLRIERIVSYGHSSPATGWYDQEDAEWVILLRGAARLEFEASGEVTLAPGDWLHIPPHERHRVSWTEPGKATVWLAVHYA